MHSQCTEHLQATMQAPTAPADTTSLHSFLGMLSWYNKFIPNYATLVEPLCACLRQDSESEWTEKAQQSFVDVKKCLVDSTAPALFNPELPVTVSTDASDYGLGAILSQMHPDHSERTVAFVSLNLTPTERRYSAVEKELAFCASLTMWCILPLPLTSASNPVYEPELVALLSTTLTAISPSKFKLSFSVVSLVAMVTR
uniref:Reverse transcriptase/retrotransposon-derived protein RNase H-like domain-containing protein n=1 Tax=Sinocyclocheilus rhinocerous TaxID=307959 RepID=A0A673IM23_9TELE